MSHAGETMPGSSTGASPLRNRYLHAGACAVIAGLIWPTFGAVIGAALLCLAARALYDHLTRPPAVDLSETLGNAVRAAGADYLGFSAVDGKAIGYDVDRRMILFAFPGQDGATILTEHGLDTVRDFSWTIEEPDQTNIYGVGPAAFAGAVQASSLNATARRQAMMRSGLSIQLADIAVPVLHICLDGDETRLRQWTELLTQATDGTVAKPTAPAVV